LTQNTEPDDGAFPQCHTDDNAMLPHICYSFMNSV